jgi:hypothetical protein
MEALLAELADVAVGWLVIGVALHLCNQCARGCAWWRVVSGAMAGEGGVRRRDAVAAWIAGAGVAGMVTARLGDALRVLLLARRLPSGSCPRLTGTLVAEGAGEMMLGSLVAAAALVFGVGPGFGLGGPLVAFAALAAGLALLAHLRHRRRGGAQIAGEGSRWRVRSREVLAGLRAGCAPLAEPAVYARRVLPWQLASRTCRIAALACFLAAFHLPVTPQAVLLVIFAQGAGNVLPFSPAALTAGAAVLAATFAPVTHTAVASGRVAAFYTCTLVLLTVIGVVMAAVITLTSTGRRTAAPPMPAGGGVPARAPGV